MKIITLYSDKQQIFRFLSLWIILRQIIVSVLSIQVIPSRALTDIDISFNITYQIELNYITENFRK